MVQLSNEEENYEWHQRPFYLSFHLTYNIL